jgi:hypothetical protein
MCRPIYPDFDSTLNSYCLGATIGVVVVKAVIATREDVILPFPNKKKEGLEISFRIAHIFSQKRGLMSFTRHFCLLNHRKTKAIYPAVNIAFIDE